MTKIFSLSAGKVHLRSVIPAKLVRNAYLIDKATLRVVYAVSENIYKEAVRVHNNFNIDFLKDKVETYSLPDDGVNESCISVSEKPTHTTSA